MELAPKEIVSLQLAAKIYLEDNNIKKSQHFANKILEIKPNDKFALEIISKIKSRNNP